ncbi:MAG: hypothetical protein OHK0023_25580 [Anaerolineae bacterium]
MKNMRVIKGLLVFSVILLAFGPVALSISHAQGQINKLSVTCSKARFTATGAVPGARFDMSVLVNGGIDFSYVSPEFTADVNGNATFEVLFPTFPIGSAVYVDVVQYSGAFTGVIIQKLTYCELPDIMVPDGFVLRTIICDSSVFGAPDVNFALNSQLKYGQAWYINPKVEPTTNRRSIYKDWNQIWVSGRIGYIPSVCIGEAPSR